ncbi:DNA polymerase III subunit delta' [Actinomyces minihominis]|uniref:DNA polymerase III subunit delta' n=1 Tax=Actinomyces minihominis TaxID=2002838 RepID=UPI000C0720D3|nr:DNA polymerase III subunit delta' [Actinomyces minihominis]
MTIWDQLIGQPEVVKTLQAAALEGRQIVEHKNAGRQALAHAWLITGPPGSGRSTAAKVLAAALQCTGETLGCGTCSGCHTVLAGTNADVQVYATDETTYKVDEVRESWLGHAYDAPTGGRWRVTIVEDADRLGDQSANAILKSVEEPPDRGIWILCAPTPREVLTTIRSRCRQLALRVPAAEEVARYLAETEGVPFEAAFQAATIAQSHVGFARGMLRNANLRDEIKAVFSLPLRATSVGQAVHSAGRMHEMVKKMSEEKTKVTDARLYAELLKSLGIREGERVPPSLRARIRDFEERQKRRNRRALADMIDRALTDLLSFYRDVLTVQFRSGASLVNIDMVNQVEEVAAATTVESSLARVEAIGLARQRNQGSAAPLLLLEALAISLVDPLGTAPSRA